MPMRIFRASWKMCSSAQWGFSNESWLANRLCSRMNKVWNEVRPGCSLLRSSPGTTNFDELSVLWRTLCRIVREMNWSFVFWNNQKKFHAKLTQNSFGRKNGYIKKLGVCKKSLYFTIGKRNTPFQGYGCDAFNRERNWRPPFHILGPTINNSLEKERERKKKPF